MDRETRHRLEERAGVIKALAHPARLFLVERLARGECCVCELTEGVGADISTVSRHLGQLKSAGIVASERRGQKVFYRLRTPCVVNFFGCIEGVLDEAAACGAGCSTEAAR